jgi:hypothetical protein
MKLESVLNFKQKADMDAQQFIVQQTQVVNQLKAYLDDRLR